MRIATVSSLYPNSAQPQRGVFVRERLRRYLNATGSSAYIVAPVPWFPSTNARLGGRYATFARVPALEQTPEGLVLHPRFLHVPKVSDTFSPWSMANAIGRAMAAQDDPVDLIDAHFLFPDGVAAVIAGARMNIPVVLTARGSDVNVHANERVAGRWIRWALRRADGLIAVSQGLASRLAALSDRTDVNVVTNGIDRELFHPHGDRQDLRLALGFDRYTVLSVGNLVPLKGHDLVLQAVARSPELELIIVGEGPEQARLTQLGSALGARVRFLGAVPQTQLARLYRAADVLVLGSASEGLPNVLLECMASGTPVIATASEGSVEALQTCRVGGRVCQRSVDAIAGAIADTRATCTSPESVAHEVMQYDWERCAQQLHDLFAQMVSSRRH